jgi:hypothetical protein
MLRKRLPQEFNAISVVDEHWLAITCNLNDLIYLFRLTSFCWNEITPTQVEKGELDAASRTRHVGMNMGMS